MDKSLLTIDNLKNVGLAGALAFILWAGFSGQWVWGTQLKEEQARTAAMTGERDKWMKLALEGTRLAEVSSHVGAPTTAFPPAQSGQSGPITAEEIAQRLDRVSGKVEPGMERTPFSP